MARKIMDAEGISIDDLYAFAFPRLRELQIHSDVHFTEAGYEALANEVAASIVQSIKP